MRLQMRGRSCTALIMAAAAAMDLSAHGFVVMPCPNHRIALTSSRSLALGRGSSSRNAAGVTRRRNRAIVAVHGLEGIASAVPDLLLANAAKAAEEGHAEAVKLMENPVAKALLNTPSGWSLILLSALLSIGQAYEGGKHALVHALPKSMRPVVDGMVGELSTLGVVGLLLGVLQVSSSDSWLAQLSTRFLGEKELLLEEFEAIHSGLFYVSATFLLACTALVVSISNQYDKWGRQFQSYLIESIIQNVEQDDVKMGRGECSPNAHSGSFVGDVSADVTGGMVLSDEDMNREGSPVFELFGKTDAIRTAEFLRFRQRFISMAESEARHPFPPDFKFWSYLERHASSELRELVKVEPYQLWWIVLFSAVSIIASDYVAEDLIVGMDPVVIPYALTQLGVGVFATWNFAKLCLIKAALLPCSNARDVGVPSSDVDSNEGAWENTEMTEDDTEMLERGEAFLPRYLDPRAASAIINHPINQLSVLEHLYKKPARNKHEELFGIIGGGGPEFYMSSMKLVLFFSILISALGLHLINYESADIPLGILELIPSIYAIALTPATFLLYNWVTATEMLKKPALIREVLSDSNAARFRTTIVGLTKFSASVEFWLSTSDRGGMDLRRTEEIVEQDWKRIVDKEHPDVLLDLRMLFDKQDADNSGCIDKGEVGKMISDLGFKLSDSELDRYFNHMDTDGSGVVGFKEFCTAVLECAAMERSRFQGRAGHTSDIDAGQCECRADDLEFFSKTFSFFDLDNSGYIDATEMHARLEGMGFDPRGVDELFYRVAGTKTRISKRRFAKYARESFEGNLATAGRDSC